MNKMWRLFPKFNLVYAVGWGSTASIVGSFHFGFHDGRMVAVLLRVRRVRGRHSGLNHVLKTTSQNVNF